MLFAVLLIYNKSKNIQKEKLMKLLILLTIITFNYCGKKIPDNLAGVVIDKDSNRVWQKCSIGQIGDNCSGSATKHTWEEAKQICKSLSLGGLEWHLPSKEELTGLATKSFSKYPNYEDSDVKIDQITFPNTQSSYYWSSDEGYRNDAYNVSFSYGYSHKREKSNLNYVRCNSIYF